MLRSIFNQQAASNFSHYITEKAHCGSTQVYSRAEKMSDYSLRSESEAREKERKTENRDEDSTEKEKIDIILQPTPCAV